MAHTGQVWAQGVSLTVTWTGFRDQPDPPFVLRLYINNVLVYERSYMAYGVYPPRLYGGMGSWTVDLLMAVPSGGVGHTSWSGLLESSDRLNYDFWTGEWTMGLDVNPGSGPLDHFEFAGIPSQIAGVPFMLTVTAKDSYGNTVTRHTGTNVLSDTTGSISPTSTGGFFKGVWSGSVTINKVANDVRVFTGSGEKVGTSEAFDVTAGPPAQLVFSPWEYTMDAGTQRASIRLQDTNGYESNATAPINVLLSTTSPHGEFREPGTKAKMDNVTFQPGQSAADIDYFDFSGGTWTIVASTTGLASGTANVTVTPDTVAPVTVIEAGVPQHGNTKALYVSGNTSFTLLATDEGSGLRNTNYRVDEDPWRPYTGPFNLSDCNDGPHTIGYSSIDWAGNEEAVRDQLVFLDGTAPWVRVRATVEELIQDVFYMKFKAFVNETGSGLANVVLTLEDTIVPMIKEGRAYVAALLVDQDSRQWVVRAVDALGNTIVCQVNRFIYVAEAIFASQTCGNSQI